MRRVSPEQRLAAANAARIARAQAAANARAAGTSPRAAKPALVPVPGGTPDYYGPSGNFANSPLPEIDSSGDVVPGSGLRKFVDSLPGLGATGANNLGQYIPVANPDTITYPGSDYYEIAAVQYTEKMHSDLPATTLRGYVQLNNGTGAGGTNTVAPAPVHYLGPTIVGTRDKPVRIKFTNMLPPTSAPGRLFLPVDTTIMGAGSGPNLGTEIYSDNRATIHLHGGLTPWISDGTPHQWVAPNLESTVAGRTYLKGVSVRDVPDMPVSPGGSVTFYYTNQQSSRLMFYHDHALGETRLNVQAGIAAGYVLTDATEQSLIASGTLPGIGTPLVIQDRTYVPKPAQLTIQDPTWDTSKWGGLGNLWYPHVYMPNQNPFSPAGVTAMGRWDYGPWFGIPAVLNGPVSNPYYPDPDGLQPPQIPGTPDVSIVAETFFDTPVVNGTAYPTLAVDPKAYRFRVLNAANDRFWNLSLLQAAPLTISVTAQGSGYTSAPNVNINGGSVTGASAAASLGVVSVNVTAGGSGYTSAPNVTIAGATGNGASAAAIMTGTSVSSILVLSQGNGYTTVPAVIISGGGGTGAGATAVLGVTQINITNRGAASSGPKVNPTITFSGGGGSGAKAIGSVLTDVTMVPAVPNPAIPFPMDYTAPTDGPNVFTSDILDGRAGGVPDPRYMGPSWIAIGNEGGFLPAPAVIPPMPIGYQHNNKNATWNGVTKKSLYMAPAERYDVIVDFSQYAGQTLVLYNDSPAPAPLFDVRNDYYTGNQDQTIFGGAPSTLAGYGPNTRTIMQINVASATPVPFNSAALETAIPAAFRASQDPILVPQSAYNTALGTNYPDDYVRVLDADFSPAASPQGVASVIIANKGALGFLTSLPTVALSGGGGSGATATVTMELQDQVSAFVIGNAGSGYTTAPTVTIGAPPAGGTQATAEAEIQGGMVVAIDVINPGSGYTVPPNVTITGGGGTGAQAACDIGTAFTITGLGTGYNAATTTVTLSAPSTGTTPTVAPYLGISSVTLLTAGTYPSYITPPTITVTGGGGSGAMLIPVMALNPIPGQLGGGSTVAAVSVVNPGGGYTTPPTITFSGGGAGAVQATATALLGVSGINIINRGTGVYITPPTVTITDTAIAPAIPGIGATAVAINKDLTTGLLGSVTVTSPGAGYTTAPQVTFMGGGGAANTAVAYATLTNTPSYSLQMKDVVAGFERYYGRLTMQQGTNLVAMAYIDPVTDVLVDSISPGSPVAGDGTQIWKINHIGVDSHPLHFHLYNVQIVNRVAIDGVINPPDPEELGWRETVRINPFESLIVAARPTAPREPFNLPDSIRPLSPTEPIGATMSFTNLTPGGGVTSIVNQLANFGWEYVGHCHILSHEENDMMRPVSFLVTSTVPGAPTGVTVTTAGDNTVNWTDPTPAGTAMGNTANEVGFQITRAPGSTGGTFTTIATVPANSTSYVDGTATAGSTYRYRVVAFNAAGSSTSATVTRTASVAPALPAVPALVSPLSAATVTTIAPILFTWGAVTGATSYTLQVLSGTTVVVNMPGLIASNINLPNQLLAPGAYTWKVSATGPRGTSAYSAANAVTLAAPPPTQIAFATAAQTISTGSVSGVMTIQTRDTAGNAANVAAPTVVTLTSSSATGRFDTVSAGPFNGSITSVSIPAGANSASFYYMDATAGAPIITAATTGLTSGTQTETVVAPAAKLAFTIQPNGALPGVVFTTQPVVAVQDATGATVTGSTAAVTIAITPGTGAPGAVLSGTATVNAVNGVATFSGLGINLAGAGYTLTATSGGLTPAVSAGLNIGTGTLTMSIPLASGWNLISTPLIPSNGAIATVFSAVSGSIISVWRYDASTGLWHSWSPALGGDLATITDGVGYWVNTSAAATLNITGVALPAPPALPPTYNVSAGWNLIGFKETAAMPNATYLVGTNYRFPVYGFGSGVYNTITAGTVAFAPGYGYWVYFNAAGVVTP